jgi:uncharacterized protein
MQVHESARVTSWIMGAYRNVPMKLTLDADPRVNLIRSYADGEVRVGEQVIRTSCIVTAEAIDAQWAPRSVDELTVAHLEPIFALTPQLVLLGTGATQRFPSAAIRSAFAQRRIGLEVMDLGAACRTFNLLVQEGRRVAAALLLT